jgi:hypothetical protein
MDNQTTVATRPAIQRTDIPGWGIDADPMNDATYPMRNRARDDAPGMHWERPAQQATDVETLRSIEYNRQPAVFGTSAPPSGLSGSVRRSAFAYSESQWAHWLLLMLADRINAAEGVVQDLASGRIPNLIEEMGLAAEWKYNRKACERKIAAAVAVTGLAAGVGYLMVRDARRRDPGVAAR